MAMVTPINGNYTLAKAQIFSGPYGQPVGVDMGDFDTFDLTPGVTTQVRNGNNYPETTPVDTILTGKSLTLAATAMQWTPENLGLQLLATPELLQQMAVTQTQTLTFPGTRPGGIMMLPHMRVTDVTVSVGGTALAPKDYEVDAGAGAIRLGLTVPRDEEAIVTYKATAITAEEERYDYAILSNPLPKLWITVRGVNSRGRVIKVELPKVSMAPAGALGLVNGSDNIAGLSLTGTVEAEPSWGKYRLGRVTDCFAVA